MFSLSDYLSFVSTFQMSCSECVKSLTSKKKWSDNVFISESNLHLTNQFYEIVLDSITNSKKNYDTHYEEL